MNLPNCPMCGEELGIDIDTESKLYCYLCDDFERDATDEELAYWDNELEKFYAKERFMRRFRFNDDFKRKKYRRVRRDNNIYNTITRRRKWQKK